MKTYYENGEKCVSYTSEELKAMRTKGEGTTDWDAAKAMTEEQIQMAIDTDPDDFTPTEKEFAHARAQRLGHGGLRPGSGRPKGSKKNDAKIPVSFRLSSDIVHWLKEQPNQSMIIENALRQTHKI